MAANTEKYRKEYGDIVPVGDGWYEDFRGGYDEGDKLFRISFWQRMTGPERAAVLALNGNTEDQEALLLQMRQKYEPGSILDEKAVQFDAMMGAAHRMFGGGGESLGANQPVLPSSPLGLTADEVLAIGMGLEMGKSEG